MESRWDSAFTHVSARKQATPERRVRNDGDTELTSGLQQADLLVLDIESEGRVFDFHRSNGVDGVRTAECFSGNLGQAQIFHLALPI